MKFSYFEPAVEDVGKIEAKECFTVGEIGCVKDLVHLSGMNSDSLAVAIGSDKGLHGILGSYRQWEGSAQAWALFDKSMDCYPIALTKACHELIAYAQKKQNLHRLSITVRSDYKKGNLFAKKLGFFFEGQMMKYLPGGIDANMYARIF
jgi:hypothetical protein